MLNHRPIVTILLALAVATIGCGGDSKDQKKTKSRKSAKKAAADDDGPANSNQGANSGGGVTLVNTKPKGRVAATTGSAPAPMGSAAAPVPAPAGSLPPVGTGPAPLPGAGVAPPGLGAPPLPPGSGAPLSPGRGGPPLPPGAGAPSIPIAPPGPALAYGDPQACEALEDRFQKCKKEAIALFNQLNEGQREVSKLGGQLEDELPKEAGVAVPGASEYSIPDQYKKYFKKKLKEPCLAGVPVEKLDMVITECMHIKKDLNEKIALNDKYTRVLRGTIQDVKEAKRALVAYANRAYAATALGAWQDANICIARMKDIDNKWTGGRGVSRIAGQLSKQQVRDPIQYGYKKCLEGNHHEGKQAYDFAKRQGADGREISYLKRKCGERLSYSPCQ